MPYLLPTRPHARARTSLPLSALPLLATLLPPSATAGCSRPQGEPSASEGPRASSTLAASPPGAPPNAPAAARKAGPPRAGCEGLFDPPEGASKLCDEHVLGGGAEIHWTSWAVTSSRMDTFRPYQARATGCGAGFTLKPPLLDVAKGDERLSIHDAGEAGYPSCAAKPDAAHPTVIVISTKHDR